MSHSFTGKILRVNLTTGAMTVDEPTVAYYRRYMGGWNIIADVLLREVPAGTDPLGPENKLIFAAGVLTGLPCSGLSRNAVGAKSPLTGGFGGSEAGGFWGVEFKRAGFDAIIFEGISPKPVYLWIKDGVAELRDATHLWGKTTKQTREGIREELGDGRIRCAMIGPGGENMVRIACIMHGLFDAAGRTGLGAVMGSKKLKAIAVRGTKPVEAADPEKIREMARQMAGRVTDRQAEADTPYYGTGAGLARGLASGNLPVNNFRDGEFAKVDDLSAENFMPLIGTGMEGCYACAVRCKKVVQTEPPYTVDPDYGGPEYETLGSFGTCCGVDNIAAVCKAGEMCNAYSLDTIGVGVTIAFAMECFEKGLLTLEDTDGLDLRFGNADAMIQAVEKIGRGSEGLGTLLAEGSRRLARRIGKGAEAFAMQVKGEEIPMHEPRFKRAMAIGYCVSPNGPDHNAALHDQGLVNAGEDGLLARGGVRGLGVLDPVPLESLGPEKVRAVMYSTRMWIAGNCLPVCTFVNWSPDQEAELVRAATGWDVSTYEVMKVGERAFNLARVFNFREGITSKDEHLPDRSYTPTTSGALAEGGLDREELRQAVHTYYAMAGWDPETGVPLPGKLQELDVAWAIEYLPGSAGAE